MYKSWSLRKIGCKRIEKIKISKIVVQLEIKIEKGSQIDERSFYIKRCIWRAQGHFAYAKASVSIKLLNYTPKLKYSHLDWSLKSLKINIIAENQYLNIRTENLIKNIVFIKQSIVKAIWNINEKDVT